PVGIYWGDEVEVYWKTIGDGSSPIPLLSLNFNVLKEEGEKFVSLFSEATYSIDNIKKFKDEKEAKVIFESKVNDLLSEVLSDEFRNEVKALIGENFIGKGVDKLVVEAVLNKVSLSVFTEQVKDDLETVIIMNNDVPAVRIRANRGTAQRYAYNLIKQIIEKNKNLNFEQLYAIFRRKNRIEKLCKIKDVKRWCLAEEDIITLADGTKVAISNQWGFNGASKPNLDNLREIAKRFGIDISLPI
ncbi:MAG: hypothetical protein K2K32_03635, partial [Muribaculaceae bacterium]|nr:hypothetical protein [Muribaculaceae bacterium]